MLAYINGVMPENVYTNVFQLIGIITMVYAFAVFCLHVVSTPVLLPGSLLARPWPRG